MSLQVKVEIPEPIAWDMLPNSKPAAGDELAGDERVAESSDKKNVA